MGRMCSNDLLVFFKCQMFALRNMNLRFTRPMSLLLPIPAACLAKGGKIRRSMRLPCHRSSVELPDEVAFYGYRPRHENLFFLSPWEFTQWFKLERLRAPSVQYTWSKWTKAGREKLKEAAGQKIRLEPYKDYVLNDETIKANSQIHVYPPSAVLFEGVAPARYDKFRHSWLLIRRQRPVIPCPQQTPLPNKRMSKSNRAKIFSVYLRPWTLSRVFADSTVPHLADLDGLRVAQPPETTELGAAAVTIDASMRRSWKQYVASALPHAARQIKSFMLACVAEGRTHEDEEEGAHRRGSTLT